MDIRISEVDYMTAFCEGTKVANIFKGVNTNTITEFCLTYFNGKLPFRRQNSESLNGSYSN
jgi:hypothetical protein